MPLTKARPLNEADVALYYRRDDKLYEVVKVSVDQPGVVSAASVSATCSPRSTTRLAASYVAVEAAA